LDALLDAKAQDFFKLGWTHVPKFTPAPGPPCLLFAPNPA
jgi:hypothetical protein